MPNITNWNMTVEEAADLSREQGYERFSDWLADNAPSWPTRPAGFVMSKHNENRYVGNDVVNRTHIITHVWEASTNRRCIDLWTLREPGESDAHLTPQEAITLATDLLAMAQEALEAQGK